MSDTEYRAEQIAVVAREMARLDLVNVVRCRDCVKWHHIDTLDGVRYGECDEWKRADSYCVPATRENGFCAWGERAGNFATCKCGEDIETNGRESVTCSSCGRVITE